MRNKATSVNIDNSNLVVYPNGRIKDNTGSGDGTPVNEFIYGDIHENKDKLIRLAGMTHNGLADNETNGYQLIEALRDLGSKHDSIQTLSSVTGVLNVSAKLGTMLNNENLICKSTADLTTETQIKGTDLSLFSITVIGNFKANEYVRLIKTGGSILLVRLVDSVNLDLAVSELLYLKKASQSEENAGVIDTVSTTPLVNKTAFIRRVNGDDSASYLASSLQNGIYPKEHYQIVDGLLAIRNKGWFSGLNVSASPASLPVSGDFASAVIETPIETGTSIILVTMNNAMDNLDYIVHINKQSQGTFVHDLNVYSEMFAPVSTTQFRVGFSKLNADITNLKIHLSVEQL